MPEELPVKTKYYIILLLSGSFALAIYLASIMNWQDIHWAAVILFLLLTFLSDTFPVKLPNGVVVSANFAITFAAIILFQPFLVVLITVLGDLLSLRKGRDFYKYIFNASQLTLSIGMAALVYRTIHPGELNLTASFFIAALAALALDFLLKSVFVTLVISFSQKVKPYVVWLINIKWSALGFLSMAPLGMIIALIYFYIGFLALPLFIIPLMIARHTFVLYMNVRETFLDTIKSLSVAIDAKDPYTKGHSSRVADYAVALARELKWPEDRVDSLRYSALIHDVGKISIPETILKKEDVLSKDEFSLMKSHAELGSDVVKDIKFFSEGAAIIKHHHERWDGSGYPDGLVGEQIPAGARILCVADAFDAMTSDRPYRRALNPRTAFHEIRKGAGSQFDPRVVEAFEKVFPRLNLEKKSPSLDNAALYGEQAAVAGKVRLQD